MIKIELDIIQTLILAIVLFLLGNTIKNKLSIFQKLCIPSPVIGGLFFCLLNLLLRLFNITTITMDTRLMPYFMSIFFTIIGISVSVALVKKGGKLLFKYLLLCGALAFFQNFLSILLSKLLNINPLLGLMCGTISMEGGHGCAAAFGTTIENLGINNACDVGIAAATFGLILGGLLGGPVAKYLIEKNNLYPSKLHIKTNHHKKISTLNSITKSNVKLTPFNFFEQILIVLLCISIGEFCANILFNLTGVILPTIVTAMFIAVAFRYFNDKLRCIDINFNLLDFISEISLGMFLTMALMSIDLFKLSSLFKSVIIIVICQVVFIVLYGVFVCFKLLGKNFDAAIIISGLIGHGLGATPNALANMNSVTQKYGNSEKAFLVVPLVSAFLLDIFTMPCIVLFINLFK